MADGKTGRQYACEKFIVHNMVSVLLPCRSAVKVTPLYSAMIPSSLTIVYAACPAFRYFGMSIGSAIECLWAWNRLMSHGKCPWEKMTACISYLKANLDHIHGSHHHDSLSDTSAQSSLRKECFNLPKFHVVDSSFFITYPERWPWCWPFLSQDWQGWICSIQTNWTEWPSLGQYPTQPHPIPCTKPILIRSLRSWLRLQRSLTVCPIVQYPSLIRWNKWLPMLQCA